MVAKGIFHMLRNIFAILLLVEFAVFIGLEEHLMKEGCMRHPNGTPVFLQTTEVKEDGNDQFETHC